MEERSDGSNTGSIGSNLQTLKEKPQPLRIYPDGHPMNDLKRIEENLLSHINSDILPITKRRKILRRLERKKERILGQEHKIDNTPLPSGVPRPGSLWDLKELPSSSTRQSIKCSGNLRNKIVGPVKPTMYTIKDNKIMRLEETGQNEEEYKAVDIILPINAAEADLREGTKMSVDDIKQINRFKNYEPGYPSKVLYLKNIAPGVNHERISLLFNQFTLANGGPIDVRLLAGKMRGQAFVTFDNEETAIQALEEVNGTILSGKPIIVQFGKNTNRIQNSNI